MFLRTISGLAVVWLSSIAASVAAENVFDELGFKGKRVAAQQIYEDVVDRTVLTNGIGKFLLAADRACRARAEKLGKSPNQIGGLSGSWLEYSVLVALHDRKMTPAWHQAELAELPNTVFDVLLWTEEHGPVVLSCKTSLRERYKQADLEGLALRKVYPGSHSFLVTLDADKKHVANCREKVVRKEITGLEAIYDESNVEELFAWLAKQVVVPIPTAVKMKRGRQIP